MEDDKKKKKKNKKKKNKQVETTDNVPVSGNDQVSKDAADDGRLDDVPVTGNGQVPETVADVYSDAMQDEDSNGNRHESNGTECSLAESEKQHWLQREATLEETIKQLQKETDLHIQKEATLEDAIKQLRNENDSHIQKEATLEDFIKQLRQENDSHIQKEKYRPLRTSLVGLVGGSHGMHGFGLRHLGPSISIWAGALRISPFVWSSSHLICSFVGSAIFHPLSNVRLRDFRSASSSIAVGFLSILLNPRFLAQIDSLVFFFFEFSIDAAFLVV